MPLSFHVAALPGSAAPAVLLVRTATEASFRLPVAKSALIFPNDRGAVLASFNWGGNAATIPGGDCLYGEAHLEALAVKRALIDLSDIIRLPDVMLPSFIRVESAVDIQQWLLLGQFKQSQFREAREHMINIDEGKQVGLPELDNLVHRDLQLQVILDGSLARNV